MVQQKLSAHKNKQTRAPFSSRKIAIKSPRRCSKLAAKIAGSYREDLKLHLKIATKNATKIALKSPV